jgi:hypothetical protein
MREKINIEVRKRFKMQTQGFSRLGRFRRSYFVPKTIKHIWNDIVDVNLISDEDKLAGFLFDMFRESAEYFVFKLPEKGGKSYKYLARLKVRKVTDNKFNHE